MKTTYYSLLLVSLSWLLPSGAVQAQTLVDQLNQHYEFPLKWKAKIGLSTFRTTLMYANGRVFAPSNGDSLGSLMDSSDGVYVINGKTGQIEKHIITGKGGDLDVNGIAIYGDRLFFGNDNNEFFSFNLQGESNWSISVNGDVEGAPAITDFDDDGQPDVVVATEAGGDRKSVV